MNEVGVVLAVAIVVVVVVVVVVVKVAFIKVLLAVNLFYEGIQVVSS